MFALMIAGLTVTAGPASPEYHTEWYPCDSRSGITKSIILNVTRVTAGRASQEYHTAWYPPLRWPKSEAAFLVNADNFIPWQNENNH